MCIYGYAYGILSHQVAILAVSDESNFCHGLKRAGDNYETAIILHVYKNKQKFMIHI